MSPVRPSPPAGRTRILLAEQDPGLRRIVGRMLQGDDALELMGEAGSADEALQIARGSAPDVALVGVDMPGGGPRAARELLRLSPRTRVVALSDRPDRRSLFDMVSAGAVSYVVKTASPAQLLSTVHGVARGEATFSSDLVGQIVAELAEHLQRRDREEDDRKAMLARVQAAIGDPAVMSAAFQPVARLEDRAPVAYLSLMRFSADAGITTAQYFDDAHRLGLEVDLELAAAVRALEQLHAVPAGARLLIKLSSAAVIGGRVRDLLRDHRPERVIVELTRHDRLQHRSELASAVQEIRGLGAQIAMDDTAVGFASLELVAALAPDYLHLAATLTHGVGTDRTRRALAVALTSFAESLGTEVIADHIETEEELRALQAIGVHLGLGFAIAPPGPLPGQASGLHGDGPTIAQLPPRRRTGGRVSDRVRAMLPSGALRSLPAASTAVVRLLEESLPDGATVFVGHFEHEGSGLFRVVEVGGRPLPGLQQGVACPVEAVLCSRMIRSAADELKTKSGADDPAANVALKVQSYAGVPVELDDGTVIGSIAALDTRPGAFGQIQVELLADLAPVISHALQVEHGANNAELIGEALREHGRTDHLTGVVNRARLVELLDAEWRRGLAAGHTSAEVVLIRLANQHGVAETRGRAVADLLLKDMGAFLEQSARPGDIVGRLDATTYACLLVGRSGSGVEHFWDDVCRRVEGSNRRRDYSPNLHVAHRKLGAFPSGEAALEISAAEFAPAFV